MGFLFLVLYPPPRPPARPPPHSLASLTHTTHSLTHPPTHARTHSLTCAFCVAGVAQSALPRGRMYALGVPWVSAPFAWQAWDNLHCQGVGCTPWRPLGLRLFCVAGVGQCALPRGRMYALASLGSPPLLRGRRGTMCIAKGSDVRPGVPWVSAFFAWQAWHNVHCQRVGCTPWRPLGLRLFCVAGVAQCALPRGRMYALASLGSPPLLRGRRGTMCIAKGSDVRPGVPWVSASFAWQAWHNVHCQGVGCTPWRPLGLRLFSVAGVAQCALPKGSDVRPGVPWVSASFAWQAWDNVHCQGVGCTPWRPLGLRLFCVAGVGQCAFCVAGVGQCALPKGSDVRPGVPWVSASFAWQAWDNVHCQGVGCTPWRPLGLRLFCVAGVGQCAFCVAGMGQCALPKGSDVRPGVPWVSASFAWQAWDNVHCQGVGCTPWRPLGLRLFCVAGVGQCAFCVAGVGQCALPRDRMYGLASLGLRLFCVAGVGQCALPRGLDVRPGVPWAPLLLRGRRGTMCILRGRRGTMCTAKGLEYALASLGLRLFCVAGAHSFTHSVTHSLTPLTPSHSLTHTPLLAHSHSLTLTYSLTHSLTLSVTHTRTLNDRWMDGWMDRWTLT